MSLPQDAVPRDHEVPSLPAPQWGPGCRCVLGAGRLLVAREPVGRKRPGDKSFSTVELPGAVGGPAAWRRPARDPAPGLQACCVGALLCGTSSVPGDVSGSRRQPPLLAPPRVWACGAPSCRLASPAPLPVPPVMSVPKLTEPGLPLAPKGAGPLGGRGRLPLNRGLGPRRPSSHCLCWGLGEAGRHVLGLWDAGQSHRRAAGLPGPGPGPWVLGLLCFGRMLSHSAGGGSLWAQPPTLFETRTRG